MKKITVFLVGFFLTSFLQGTSSNQSTSNNALAEVVDLQKDEKDFGDWKVYCETDVMMDNSHCKIAAKFFDSSSVMTVEPTSKFFNQLFIVIPQIKIGSFVKVRIDKNDLILSDTIQSKDFGLISLSEESKNAIFRQIKSGDFLFFRFNVRNSEKEITIKVSLKDFRNALSYYNSRVFRQ